MTAEQRPQVANPTPGPWEVDESRADGAIPIEHDGEDIAAAWFLDLIDETQANARLIAAAPDLLAALLLAEWGGLSDGHGEPPYCPVCSNDRNMGHHERCQLAAALAKARGES